MRAAWHVSRRTARTIMANRLLLQQFSAYQELVAARLENNPVLIAELAGAEELLSRALAEASAKVVTHRAAHWDR